LQVSRTTYILIRHW